MDDCTLYNETLKLVRNKPRTLTYKQIADETGVGFWWLKEFAMGKYNNPHVRQTQTLYEYLSGNKLNLSQ